MDKEQVFYILDLKETKDEDQIRSAYLDHLKHVNPEDDPEGFKRLREAYETAIALARKPEEDSETEKTEIDLWLDKADVIYRDVRKRIQITLWKELFDDPLCQGFDVSLEARERFIFYLMEHYYLPQRIWKAIEEEFHIVEDNIENLKKNIHENFLNYAKYNIENDGFITYHNFRHVGRDGEEGQTDSYIRKYLDIKKQIDNGEYQGAIQELNDLKAFGIYHPYEDVERLRLLLAEGQLTEAGALCDTLLNQYDGDIYILIHAANCRWELEQPETAFSLWNRLLTMLPDNVTAKIGLAKYYSRNGDYNLAKKYVQEILEAQPRHPDAISMLEEINTYLIEKYQNQLSEIQESDGKKQHGLLFKLAWCYFQNLKYPETINILENITPDLEDDYEYHNLFSRALANDQQFERALPYLLHWRKLILETPDDGSEESHKRVRRKALAYYLIGFCHHELGRHSQGAAEINQALEYEMPLADRLAFMLHLSDIYITSEEYSKAVDVSDALLKEDAGYYPAYINRMKAAYEMDNGQMVINDFHQATDIYDGYFMPYLLAIKVYCDHNQYKDAWEVIEKARESKVEFNDQMLLYEVRIKRNLAQTDEESQEALILCRQLYERIVENKTAETDLKDISELYFEMGMLYCNEDSEDDLAQAYMWISRAQKEDPQREQYKYVEANILRLQKKYQAALEVFKRFPESSQEMASHHYYLGICYEEMGEKEQAIKCYEQALERDDKYRDTADKLSKIYLQKYQETYHKEDYLEALEYASKQIEADDCAYYLIERGNAFEAGMLLEDALADYRRAMEYEPDNLRAYYCMGHCYMLMGRFKEAIEQLTEVASSLEEKSIREPGPYDDLASCHEAFGDYPKAIACIRKNLEMYPDYFPFEERIAQCYYYSQQYQEAIDLYRDIAKQHGVSDLEYGSEIGNAYFYMGLRRKASAIYRKMILFKATFDNMINAAKFFHKDMKKYRRAERYYLRATMLSSSHSEKAEIALAIAEFYYERHNLKWAKEYSNRAYKNYLAVYGSEEACLNYLPSRPKNLVRIGKCYLYMGDREKALAYFEQIGKCYRCDWCQRVRCSELYEIRAVYYKSIKEWQKALADYQAAYDIPPNQQDGRLVAEIAGLKQLLESDKT